MVRGHELYNSNYLLGGSFQRKINATIRLNILYLLLIFYSAYIIYVN
jgi:hypothetical protein